MPFSAPHYSRVRIEEIGEESVETYKELLEANKDFVPDFITNPPPEIYADADEIIDFGIWSLHRLVGGIKLARYNLSDPSAEHQREDVGRLSFWLDLEDRGYKYATQALELIKAQAFTRLGITRLVASVNYENVPAARSLSKAGFDLIDTVINKDWIFSARKDQEPREPLKKTNVVGGRPGELQIGILEINGMSEPITNGNWIVYTIDPYSGDKAEILVGRKTRPHTLEKPTDVIYIRPNVTYLILGINATLRANTLDRDNIPGKAETDPS